MKLQMRLLLCGFAFFAMACLADAAETRGGFESFPTPEPTITLGETGGSLRMADDDPVSQNSDSDPTAKSDGSLLSRIDLTAIPEPPVYMLLGLGLLVCVQRMIRRRRAAR